MQRPSQPPLPLTPTRLPTPVHADPQRVSHHRHPPFPRQLLHAPWHRRSWWPARLCLHASKLVRCCSWRMCALWRVGSTQVPRWTCWMPTSRRPPASREEHVLCSRALRCGASCALGMLALPAMCDCVCPSLVTTSSHVCSQLPGCWRDRAHHSHGHAARDALPVHCCGSGIHL